MPTLYAIRVRPPAGNTAQAERPAHRIAQATQQENIMASNPSNSSRSNKTSPKTKRADARPALGVALNWVPPKAPASTKAPAKKRPPAPQ